jgi:putative holliday junction resolvase
MSGNQSHLAYFGLRTAKKVDKNPPAPLECYKVKHVQVKERNAKHMTRLIALDVGEARIGVAISDATGLLASPYTTLHIDRGDETKVWAAIQECIDDIEADGLVIGLPISLDGQIHTQGERVQAFAERLQQHIALPVVFWDERLSTVEAQRLLAERNEQERGKRPRQKGQRPQQGRRHAKRRQRGNHEIDAMAATVILQEYLDSLGRETKETTV